MAKLYEESIMKVTKISEKYEITEGEYSIYVTKDNGFWEIAGPSHLKAGILCGSWLSSVPY